MMSKLFAVLILLIDIYNGDTYVCDGTNMCPTQMNCKEKEPCIITCSASWSCRHKIVDCPSNHRCEIHCINPNAQRQCEGITINAQTSSYLLINASLGNSALFNNPDPNTMDDSIINCPFSKQSIACSIHCDGDDLLRGTQIYSVQGFNGIYITASHYIKKWCYRAGTMLCTPDFSAKCPIATDHNPPFRCNTGTSSDFTCDDYTLNPTILPTHIPSLSPTIKSLLPTHIPSLSQTINLSLLSTNIPSITVSLSPTINPSLSQTNRPSITPSLQPTIIPSNNSLSVASMFPTVLPTEETLDEAEYSTVDRTPIGSWMALILIGGPCCCVVLFIIYRYNTFENAENANKLQLQYKNKYRKDDYFEDGLSEDAPIITYLATFGKDGSRKEAFNRMKTKDELYAKEIIREHETEVKDMEQYRNKKQKESACDEVFSQHLSNFASQQDHDEQEILNKMANDDSLFNDDEGASGSDEFQIKVSKKPGRSLLNLMRSRSKSRSQSKSKNKHKQTPPKLMILKSSSNNGHDYNV